MPWETGVFPGFSGDINCSSRSSNSSRADSKWERRCRGLGGEEELTAAACGGSKQMLPWDVGQKGLGCKVLACPSHCLSVPRFSVGGEFGRPITGKSNLCHRSPSCRAAFLVILLLRAWAELGFPAA